VANAAEVSRKRFNYAATANLYSDDVTISAIVGSSNPGQYSGDGSSANVGIIVGPIVGGVAGITGLVVLGIAAYFAYKYIVHYRGRGSVNFGPTIDGEGALIPLRPLHISVVF